MSALSELALFVEASSLKLASISDMDDIRGKLKRENNKRRKYELVLKFAQKYRVRDPKLEKIRQELVYDYVTAMHPKSTFKDRDFDKFLEKLGGDSLHKKMPSVEDVVKEFVKETRGQSQILQRFSDSTQVRINLPGSFTLDMLIFLEKNPPSIMFADSLVVDITNLEEEVTPTTADDLAMFPKHMSKEDRFGIDGVRYLVKWHLIGVKKAIKYLKGKR